jgi:hypothetical protein
MTIKPKHVAGTLKRTNSCVVWSLTSNCVLNGYVLVMHNDKAKSSVYDIDDVELPPNYKQKQPFPLKRPLISTILHGGIPQNTRHGHRCQSLNFEW